MILEYKKCFIKLNEVESNFLLEELENNISLKNVKRAITNLYLHGSRRYYREFHINEISNNLYKKLKLIEMIGRNLRTSKYDKLSGGNSGNISPTDVLNFNDIANINIGFCSIRNKDLVNIKYNNNKTKIIYCNSPEEANNIIKNINFKNM